MRELGTWMPSDLGSHNRSAHWSRMTSFWTEPASFRANQSQAIVFPSVAPQSLRFVFNDSSACCVVFDEFQFRFFSFHFACSAWLDIAFLILHVSRTISPFFGGGVQGKEQVFFFARFLRFLSVLLLLVVDGMAWFCCSTTRWWLGSKKPGRSPFSFRFFSVASARVETGWGWGWSDCFFSLWRPFSSIYRRPGAGEGRPFTPTAAEMQLPWKRNDDDDAAGASYAAVKQSEFPLWVENKEYTQYSSPTNTFLGKPGPSPPTTRHSIYSETQ